MTKMTVLLELFLFTSGYSVLSPQINALKLFKELGYFKIFCNITFEYLNFNWPKAGYFQLRQPVLFARNKHPH